MHDLHRPVHLDFEVAELVGRTWSMSADNASPSRLYSPETEHVNHTSYLQAPSTNGNPLGSTLYNLSYHRFILDIQALFLLFHFYNLVFPITFPLTDLVSVIGLIFSVDFIILSGTE